MQTQLWAIALVLSACFLGSFGPIMLKKASGKSFKIKDIIKNYYLIGGFLLYAIGTVLFIPCLKRVCKPPNFKFIFLKLFRIREIKRLQQYINFDGNGESGRLLNEGFDSF